MTGQPRQAGPSRAALTNAQLGINQILWANDDLPELNPPIDAEAILDEMARLGFKGSQLGTTFPRGERLRDALAARDMRIAEVYTTIECTADGPVDGALEAARESLEELCAADGDVLVPAVGQSHERARVAGRANEPRVPRLTDEGMARLAGLLDALGGETRAAGRILAFHHHGGTYVETPDELEQLMAATDPEVVGICLDTGHYLMGGGEPVTALRRYGERVRHVHLKDIDPGVLARMQTGELGGFLAGIRERVFTEVGSGSLDVSGVLATLAGRDYRGWLIVEQDTSWHPPSESAAMSYGVVTFVLRNLDRRRMAA